MIASVIPLKDKTQTARRMYAIIDKFSGDLDKISIAGRPLSRVPLSVYFDFVKTIPYRRDPRPREIVARPAHLIRHKNAGLDCKKKSLLIAAWAAANRVPYRFMASSRRADRRVHHVFPQLKISGRYINADATYPRNSINEQKQLTRLIKLAKDSI